MDLSIIIISWNTRGLLKQCLDSVLVNPPLGEYEIFVVDNASSDGSVAMVRECFPEVHLIENRENVGFARANNQAIRASSGEYILLLNSDTIIQPGALQNMLAFMTMHSQPGIVGGYILNPDRTPQVCSGHFPTLVSEAVSSWGLDSRLPFSVWFTPHSDSSAEWVETDWVLGAALMTRREVLDQVGGLDEEYFMYSEEIDLAYRVKNKGWRNYVLQTAPIIHLGHQSTDQAPARMKAELFRSKIRYFQKHKGAISALLLGFIFASSILAKRWFYWLTGSRAQSELWAKTWCQFAV